MSVVRSAECWKAGGDRAVVTGRRQSYTSPGGLDRAHPRSAVCWTRRPWMSSVSGTLGTCPTVRQDGPVPVRVAADEAGPGTSLLRSRSTVLPRVVTTGGAPALVNEERPRYEHERLLGEGGMG